MNLGKLISGFTEAPIPHKRIAVEVATPPVARTVISSSPKLPNKYAFAYRKGFI